MRKNRPRKPIPETIRKAVPEPIRALLRPIRIRFIDKHSSEFEFWKARLKLDGGVFANEHYRQIMLAMAEETDDIFLKNKIVADFGCGPRGSLAWADKASIRIGIDVLADWYADEFTSNILAHKMIYLTSTEDVIPLPSNFVDVMFTVNALDHTWNFPRMCLEIVRVIKPGGLFIGSFNLEESPTISEPQKLSEASVSVNLLEFLEVESYRITKKLSLDTPYGTSSSFLGTYTSFLEGNLSYQEGQEGVLWIKARKPLDTD